MFFTSMQSILDFSEIIHENLGLGRLFRYLRYILLHQNSNSVTLATGKQANKETNSDSDLVRLYSSADLYRTNVVVYLKIVIY